MVIRCDWPDELVTGDTSRQQCRVLAHLVVSSLESPANTDHHLAPSPGTINSATRDLFERTIARDSAGKLVLTKMCGMRGKMRGLCHLVPGHFSIIFGELLETGRGR